MSLNSAPRRQSGLTLLELLVVLLIAGMAIALGFQSLEQWRRANTAIHTISGATQQSALTESWLKESLRSIIPIEGSPFTGSAEKLEAITVQPILSHQGGATNIQWRIEDSRDGALLQLQENDNTLELPLTGSTRARFSYLDKEGRSYSEWPPRLGLHDHLPASIVLQQEQPSGYELIWTATIAGARNPLFNPFEPDPTDE